MNAFYAIRLTVTGLVQGVGYRPFVRREALKRSICGYVRNSGGGVCIYACGCREALDSFVQCLLTSPPAGTVYTDFQQTDASCLPMEGFDVMHSSTASLLPMASPDIAPCSNCEKELFDPQNRRFRYPFISCAQCGPRFSVQTALPYDRQRTTMADFSLCAPCLTEYSATEGRRSYAQTQACPDCGPKLIYQAPDGRILTADEALSACIAQLADGNIAAVKNIGGFHLACKADNEAAVLAIRRIKGREKKPFALLFPDLTTVKKVAEVSDAEEALLISSARPIVLLKRKRRINKNKSEFSSACEFYEDTGKIAPSVCSNSRYIGVMLPASPLQMLLSNALGILVMTSANSSGAPLCVDAKELTSWLPASVGVLDNDRPIAAAQDDSLCFVENGKTLFLRRARGYAPLPIRLKLSANVLSSHSNLLTLNLLAVGGDLKAVFALTRRDYVYLSPYIGDLEEEQTAKRWQTMLAHMSGLLGIVPTLAVCDLHPGYFSVQIAQKQVNSMKNRMPAGKKLIKVQHHHAHIASVMAEHGLTELLGFAFDGTGYGSDGSIWGGELLYCKEASFERLMYLKPLPLIGGDDGAKDCRRCAGTFLLAAGKAPWNESSKLWRAALSADVNQVYTSSMGRLFDAAASILNICQYNDYEGQAAMLLEQTAEDWQEEGGKAVGLELPAEGTVWRSDLLLLELNEKKCQGLPIGGLALGFHLAIADAVIKAALNCSEKIGCGQIGLSGGVFANRLLLKTCIEGLTAKGLSVYINEQVPAGDGGLALGQVYLAAVGTVC